MSDFTEDDFLGGRLRVRQPARGYRSGIDPVLLAASVPAKSGDHVLELGTGGGVALLCLMSRISGLSAVGVERNSELARLASENSSANGLAYRVIETDLRQLPADLRGRSFDHVLANPPYFDRTRGSAATQGTREEGRGEETSLLDWVDAGVRRLKPGGKLTMIQRVDRVPELLSCLDGRVGDVVLLPISARVGRDAKLAVLQAKKGAKGSFRLLPPFVMHSGGTHLSDGDDYTPEASGILRDGAPLDLSGLMNR